MLTVDVVAMRLSGEWSEEQARFILLFCVLDVQRWSSHQIVIARHKAISKFKCFDT